MISLQFSMQIISRRFQAESFLHVTFFPLAVKSYIDIRKVKITAKFQCLKRVFIEDTKGFMTPEKFRDVRETGPNRVNQLNSQ